MEVEVGKEFPARYMVEAREPEVFTVLKPDGDVVEENYGVGYKPSWEELVSAYKYMVLGRALDKYALLYHRMGKVKSTYAPHEGHEAADVGTAMALRPEDWIAPYYRNLTLLLVRGVPLEVLWAKFMAKLGDPDKGRNLAVEWGGFRQWRLLSFGAPIGHHLIAAAGFAYGLRYRGGREVVAAYVGDGGTSTNGFYSSLIFSSVFSLPVAIFIYNNGYAISVPSSRQSKTKRLATRAAGFGVLGIAADGMDLLATLKAAKFAVEYARSNGPVLVELVTYRFGPHTTADDPQTKYRDRAEVEEAKSRDPVARLEKFLLRNGLLSEGEVKSIWQEAEERVKSAAKQAESLPDVPPEELYTDMFEEEVWITRD